MLYFKRFYTGKHRNKFIHNVFYEDPDYFLRLKKYNEKSSFYRNNPDLLELMKIYKTNFKRFQKLMKIYQIKETINSIINV